VLAVRITMLKSELMFPLSKKNVYDTHTDCLSLFVWSIDEKMEE
jgi:hypothetical protein